MKTNIATERLHRYQKENFKSYRTTASGGEFDFDYRAYPETAEGVHLDGLAHGLIVNRAKIKGVIESDESLRSRLINFLAEPSTKKDETE